MRLIDKLLMKAKKIHASWIADTCIVFYDPERKKWAVKVSAHNDSANMSVDSDETFSDMESAVKFCEEFLDECKANATIIINDIMPGGEVYGKDSFKDDNSNGG